MLSQKDLNLLDNPIPANVFSKASPVSCSLSHELPAVVSPSILPRSLSLWAVTSLVNIWRAALHSHRSTPDYYARDTNMFVASTGRGTHHVLI